MGEGSCFVTVGSELVRRSGDVGEGSDDDARCRGSSRVMLVTERRRDGEMPRPEPVMSMMVLGGLMNGPRAAAFGRRESRAWPTFRSGEGMRSDSRPGFGGSKRLPGPEVGVTGRDGSELAGKLIDLHAGLRLRREEVMMFGRNSAPSRSSRSSASSTSSCRRRRRRRRSAPRDVVPDFDSPYYTISPGRTGKDDDGEAHRGPHDQFICPSRPQS